MKTLFIGQHYIELESIGSTNNYAKELIQLNKVVDGTLINAISQQNGRGQREATWESETGKNLTFSLVLQPRNLSAQFQFMISKCFSIAIYRFIKTKTSENVFIKWPNHILINKKKICGILIENMILSETIKYSIVGVGININQQKFSSTKHADSLRNITGMEYDLKQLLEELCGFIESQYLLLKSNQFESIDKEYLNALFQLNQWADYEFMGKKIRAMVRGVDFSGRLILSKEDGGTLNCNIKEVEFLY